jgi:uncharacterized membrane protein
MSKNIRNERERWEQDIATRQRNIVFPDTALNEGRFWKNLYSAKWGVVQIVGIILMILTLAAVLYSTISIQLSVSGISGTLWQRIWGNFQLLISGAGILVILLFIGLIVNRRSNSSSLEHRRR